jgi:hypothetical protein
MTYCTEIAATMQALHALDARIRAGEGEKTLRPERATLERRETELRDEAAKAFAKLNGWKHSDTPFAPTMLARGSTQYKRCEYGCNGGREHDLFDHPLYFREPTRPYRPVAIVGQPYNTDLAKARVMATRIGLDVHAPTMLTASWWFPGWTRFLCFTRPGTTVLFLPDQQQAVPCPEM